MNHFQLPYYERLQSWNQLRTKIKDYSLLEKCVEIDDWWQRAPLINRYLHPQDSHNWPGPWELLHENQYCTVARAIGMCYTLLLADITNIELADATNEIGEDYIIVLVDSAKYCMNYHPRSVVNTAHTQFTIKRKYDISALHAKLK
jgi:hypothetical protein